MKFSCDACGAQYMIADEKVGSKGVKVKCKKCEHMIIVRPAAAGDADTSTPPPGSADDAPGASFGAGDAFALADGLLYFFFFGLGFGWLLVVLPLIALPVQRRLVGWLARNNALLNRISGVLLIAVGVFGILTELVPQIAPQVLITPPMWIAYWLVIAGITAVVIAITRQAN